MADDDVEGIAVTVTGDDDDDDNDENDVEKEESHDSDSNHQHESSLSDVGVGVEATLLPAPNNGASELQPQSLHNQRIPNTFTTTTTTTRLRPRTQHRPRPHLIQDLMDDVMASATNAPNAGDDFELTDEEKALLDAFLMETAKTSPSLGAMEVYAFNNPKLIPVASWISSDILLNPTLTESDIDVLVHPQVSYPNNDLVGLLWSREDRADRANNHERTRAEAFTDFVGRHGEMAVDHTLQSMVGSPHNPPQHASAPPHASLPTRTPSFFRNLRHRPQHEPHSTRPSFLRNWRNRSQQQQQAPQSAHSTRIRPPGMIPRGRVPKTLHWTELLSVIDDPDQSHGGRTEALYHAGLDRAAGIAFDTHGSQGMVVFYAKVGHDPTVVTDPAHETYLRRIAQVKGALLAAFASKRALRDLVVQHPPPPSGEGDGSSIVGPLTESHGTSETQVSSAIIREPSRRRFVPCVRRFRKGVEIWLRKALGGGAQIPPAMSWWETLWTFCGCLLGFLALFGMNQASKMVTDAQYYLVAGPFGALMMLQYGMTGAPAAQPRNILFGYFIAGTVSLSFTYIPEEILPRWLRMVLSPCVSISIMVKLGVPCPPASAHSLIYAEGNHNWNFFLLGMVCSAISIIPATAFNNLNPKRQYPTFWWYCSPGRFLTCSLNDNKAKHRKDDAENNSR